ncbi:MULTISPECIES: hypothetical protein [unclassified Variovorax]|uniref:hypothetical protein n=1 Tax=unclassified Variovorax TaxID=663243 RepID=UPI001160507B|nr:MULTISPECIES: hypothetical protein [unclassified Variovorax]
MAEFVGHREALDTPPGIAPAHGQDGRAVEPANLLVVHVGEVRAEHVMDAPIAKASAHVRDLDDLPAELLGYGIDPGWIAPTVA